MSRTELAAADSVVGICCSKLVHLKETIDAHRA
jgi:hypothetical protein